MIDGVASLFREKVEEALDEKILELQASLAGGACKSLEDYKDKCGYIRALREMPNILNEVAQGLLERK